MFYNVNMLPTPRTTINIIVQNITRRAMPTIAVVVA